MPLRTDNFAAVPAGVRSRSLFLCPPTHRHHSARQQDPVRYRSLEKELERSSLEQSLEAEVADFLEPFDALEHDVEYWGKFLEEQQP